MGKIYLISDLHLGHENMAIHRGFKNAEKHDDYLISQWNKVITKRDTVWVLGDITMEKTKDYYKLDMLHGYKKVVLGNHDQPQHVTELLKYVNCVCGMYQYENFIFTHCPIHESELHERYFNIHGHIHERIIENSRYINVCCEQLDYTPIALDTLEDIALNYYLNKKT